MRVVRPTTIIDAMLASSSIVENDYPAWAAGNTYAADARVIRTSTHRIYQSIAAGNVGNVPELRPDKWLDVAPTNRWAMYDQSVGTDSQGTGSITFEIAPGGIDILGLVNLDATSVTVTEKVSGTTIYTRTINTAAGGSVIDDWYKYFFEPVGVRTVLVFDDVPNYPTGIIDVTITGSGPTTPVSCGTVVVGRALDLGSTESGVDLGINDYSKKMTDDFGTTSVVQRAWSKQMTLRTITQSAFVDGIERELAKLRATPTLWLGDDGYDSLAIYGFYKDFKLNLAFANIAYCSLTIEGLAE